MIGRVHAPVARTNKKAGAPEGTPAFFLGGVDGNDSARRASPLRGALRASKLACGAICQTRCAASIQSLATRKRAHPPFGGQALVHLAEWTGLEPATPGVTGRYSNQLNYHSNSWWVLTGSNRRPSPCKGDALPAELSTPNVVGVHLGARKSRLKRHSNIHSARPSGSSGALVYGILQAFASLESGNIARPDLDRFNSSRVASHTCCTRLYCEGSEADQRNRSAL